MKKLSRFLETFLALAVSAWAQTAPPAGSALTNQDVVTLAKAGFNEDFIIETISLSRTRFDTSAAGVAALAREGLTERIIRSMVAACEPAAAPAPSAPSALAAAPAPSSPPREETAPPPSPVPATVPAATVTQWEAQTPPVVRPAVLPSSVAPPARATPPSTSATPQAAPSTPAASEESTDDSAGKPVIRSKTYVVKPSATRQAISTQTPYRESTTMLWGLWKKQVEVGAAPHGDQVVAPALGEFFKQVRREAGPPPAAPQSSDAYYQVPVRYVVLQ
jgi:hypothetical protein